MNEHSPETLAGFWARCFCYHCYSGTCNDRLHLLPEAHQLLSHGGKWLTARLTDVMTDHQFVRRIDWSLIKAAGLNCLRKPEA